MDDVVQTLSKFNISALLVIGGFEVKKKKTTFSFKREFVCLCKAFSVVYPLDLTF